MFRQRKAICSFTTDVEQFRALTETVAYIEQGDETELLRKRLLVSQELRDLRAMLRPQMVPTT
jgi:hypothetical protein